MSRRELASVLFTFTTLRFQETSPCPTPITSFSPGHQKKKIIIIPMILFSGGEKKKGKPPGRSRFVCRLDMWNTDASIRKRCREPKTRVAAVADVHGSLSALTSSFAPPCAARRAQPATYGSLGACIPRWENPGVCRPLKTKLRVKR